MNEDGSLGIPHDVKENEGAPAAEPISSGDSEVSDPEPASDALENNQAIAIDHNNMADTPKTINPDSEPVDIFASPDERTTTTSYQHRDRYRRRTPNANANIPSFFSDAIAETNVPAQPKRTIKKGLIIGIVAGVAVLVLVVMAVVLLSKVKKENTIVDENGNTINVSAKEEFYDYANEILYGKKSNQPFNESISSTSYAFLEKVRNGEEYDETYFNNVHQKYKSFYNHLLEENSGNLPDGTLETLTARYMDLLDFLKMNPASDSYSSANVIKKYAANGAEAAKKESEKILQTFLIDNKYAREFHDLKKQTLDNAIDYASIAEKAGCIKDGEIQKTCIDSKNLNNANGENAFLVVRRDNSTEQNSLDAYYRQMGSDCWAIKRALEGEITNEED